MVRDLDEKYPILCFRFVSKNWLNTITQSAAWQTPISREILEKFTQRQYLCRNTTAMSFLLCPRGAIVSIMRPNPPCNDEPGATKLWSSLLRCEAIIIILEAVRSLGKEISYNEIKWNVKRFKIFSPWFDERDKDHSLARFRIMSKFKMETGNYLDTHFPYARDEMLAPSLDICKVK